MSTASLSFNFSVLHFSNDIIKLNCFMRFFSLFRLLSCKCFFNIYVGWSIFCSVLEIKNGNFKGLLNFPLFCLAVCSLLFFVKLSCIILFWISNILNCLFWINFLMYRASCRCQLRERDGAEAHVSQAPQLCHEI